MNTYETLNNTDYRIFSSSATIEGPAGAMEMVHRIKADNVVKTYNKTFGTDTTAEDLAVYYRGIKFNLAAAAKDNNNPLYY